MSDNEVESIHSIEDESIEQDDNNYKEICSVTNSYDKYYSNSKKTKPFMTKFEQTKLIGIRAQMISDGSEPMIIVPKHITNSIHIAELEFKEKKIPLFIKRYINATEYEYWRQEDMISV